jgi:hypothetical protein
VPSQQLQGQLQTQHSVDTSNYIMGEHNFAKKQANKVIIIQFNSCLFTCRLNSPEASYKVSTGKKKQQQNTYKENTKQGSLCNSVITIP